MLRYFHYLCIICWGYIYYIYIIELTLYMILWIIINNWVRVIVMRTKQYGVIAQRRKAVTPLAFTPVFGICGHPLNAVAYGGVASETPGYVLTQADKDHIDQQLVDIAALEFTSYRVDCFAYADGSVKQPARFAYLIQEAAAANIELLAILSGPVHDTDTSLTAYYQRGLDVGVGFATLYGEHFSHIELGNEYVLSTKLPQQSGRFASHYDTEVLNQFLNYLKGIALGLKSIKPSLLLAIDSTAQNVYFMEACINEGVDFDIIAWHWYSHSFDWDNSPITGQSNFLDMYDEMADLVALGGPSILWITEYNRAEGTTDEFGTNTMVKFLIDQYNTFRTGDVIVRMYIYELYDQGALVGGEATFGLHSCSDDICSSPTQKANVDTTSNQYTTPNTPVVLTTPNTKTFTSVTGATTSTVYTSNLIGIRGINQDISLSISGGTYELNETGGYVSDSVTDISEHDLVSLRVTSSSSAATEVIVTVTIGARDFTYSVTTA